MQVEIKGWQQEPLKPARLLKPSNGKTAAYETLIQLKSQRTRQKKRTWQRTFFLLSLGNELAVLHAGSCDIRYSVHHKASFGVNEHGFSSDAPKTLWDLYVYGQLHTAMGNGKERKYLYPRALPFQLTPKVTFLLGNTWSGKQYHCYRDQIYNAV